MQCNLTKQLSIIILATCFLDDSFGQKKDSIVEFRMYQDVRINIDIPTNYSFAKNTIIILYALPNGNTTEQTMGKKINANDDWHFDIQHIKAQTKFVRAEITKKNIVVAYLENDYKSWPTWKAKHAKNLLQVPHIVDTLYSLFTGKRKQIYLNGHSGGGSFIFSYLKSITKIPGYIRRISFLDSDYNYDSTYLNKLKSWLQNNKEASLNVFAYNDSVALYNDKRIVSDTGGTWYRSFLMLHDLSNYFNFNKIRDDSLIVYTSSDKKIQFYFKTNPEKKIFHTVQVELNGFIHSVLLGTKRESKNYNYFGQRAYTPFIQ